MPNSPIQSAESHNDSDSNSGFNTTLSNSGEKYLVQNWGTIFHSIQTGADDISFTHDPFEQATAQGPTGTSGNNGTSGLVMKLNYPKGSYAPAYGPVVGGAQFYANPFGDSTPFSKMMISYDVGFPVGFNWVLGGKLPGVYGGTPYDGCSGGIQSNGDNCLSMRMMWRQNGIGEVYAYVPGNQKSAICRSANVLCNDQYGKSLGRGLIYFQSGKWTRLDMIMELNEPAGNSNGTLQVYINGNQVIDMHDIPYRSSGMVGFQGLMFSTFFGGSEPEYATPVDTSIYFRNIQLSAGAPAKLYKGTGGNGGGRITAAGSNSMWSMLSFVFSVFILLL
ncbi:hypothetical protein BC939DRAFT_399114 [Gamsiella multidivaricata]|uniref:uncharacterized protein n=1 Tax=Gamsiella multidivaricata TaxID=101098 RepID=UPI00221EC27D|nr:uncharacterized protein BC939DRAFT_399114 [Gamsiella multidivaricata]KAI7820818.1 hypothetical protein BC939DRAFT_399114 [Gamsiella multidivaricata]